MLHTSKTRCRFAFILTLIGTSAGGAVAQDDDEARYDALVAQAVTEFNAGGFAEAYALFRQAHELLPSARTHRGLGMSAFELRRYVEALRELAAALADTRRALDESQREQVRALMERSEPLIGRFTVRLTPAGASLTVGGEPVTLDDGLLALDIGTHELVAAADGYEPWTQTLEVLGGEAADVEIALRVAPEPEAIQEPSAVVATAAEESPSSVPDTTPRDGGNGTAIAAALLGVGGALAVTSIGGGILWGTTNGEIVQCRDAIHALERGCLNESALESRRSAAAGLTIAAGLGALVVTGIGVGALLGGEGNMTSAFECVPGVGGVMCHGRF